MVGGGIAMLRRLAAALDTQRPVYGLQARGLEPTQEPRRTVEEMAGAYTDAIRVVQPEGPYALCGYSFGGLVAFEMACQFSARGQELDFLALIDPEAHPAALPRAAYWRFRAALPFRLFGHVIAHPRTTLPEYTAASGQTPEPATARLAARHPSTSTRSEPSTCGWRAPRKRPRVSTGPGFYRGSAALFLADEGRRVGACDPARSGAITCRASSTSSRSTGATPTSFSQQNVGPLGSAVSTALRRAPDHPPAP